MMSDITVTDTSGVMLGGRYLLREPVGEGGMAVVWRAYDTHLKRDVALKLLHEHVLPVDRERFGREIRTLAQISHPGIIGIYDLGEDAGRVFFTMELLTGGLISSIGPLEDSSEDFERFLSVACEAADALAHIHAKGIVHRDLTPRNILLDKDFHPRVMDFGLVYVSDATRDLTRTGYTLGTPQYMAPEQARGGVVEAASDLYAFGAVLYRAATGRAVFEADNDQGVLYQHVYEKPKALELINPAVPSAISSAVLQFLEKQSGDRPVLARVTLEAAAEHVWREHVPAQFRGGTARTGVHPGGPARADQLKPTWSINLPGEIAWPMAVTANRDHFAVGTRSGVLSVLELASGARYADFPSNDEVTAPATFDGDAIVYAGWDGLVRCVEWRTGITRWTHRTRAEITAAPTKWGETWLIASRDEHLHAVKNGKTIWAYRTGAAMAGSPVAFVLSATKTAGCTPSMPTRARSSGKSNWAAFTVRPRSPAIQASPKTPFWLCRPGRAKFMPCTCHA
jgi:eukaryotic-like serine/threonine-protein kinase